MISQHSWNLKMVRNGSIFVRFGVSGHQSGAKFHEESIGIGPGVQNCHEVSENDSKWFRMDQSEIRDHQNAQNFVRNPMG